jgi:hypothetical protein
MSDSNPHATAKAHIILPGVSRHRGRNRDGEKAELDRLTLPSSCPRQRLFFCFGLGPGLWRKLFDLGDLRGREWTKLWYDPFEGGKSLRFGIRPAFEFHRGQIRRGLRGGENEVAVVADDGDGAVRFMAHNLISFECLVISCKSGIGREKAQKAQNGKIWILCAFCDFLRQARIIETLASGRKTD